MITYHYWSGSVGVSKMEKLEKTAKKRFYTQKFSVKDEDDFSIENRPNSVKKLF